MKFLLSFTALGFFFACGVDNEDSQDMFAIRKKSKTPAVYYYAKYRFAYEGYKDVDVAVKVETKSEQVTRLWVRDLIATNHPLEEAALTASASNFNGISSGEYGGTYTGMVETGSGGVTGCCGEMTFVPTATDTLTFVGIKLEVLTAAQWEELNGGVPQPTTPDLMVAELGTQKIGNLFGITGAENVQRLEAHNSTGKVEGALARWQTEAGADIFAVTGTDLLFLTNLAMITGVTKLVGFDKQGNKILKANLTVAAHDDTIILTAARFERGGYTWVAFSANPNPDPDNINYLLDVEKNAYLSFDTNMLIHAHHTGMIAYEGYDGRGYWAGIETFACLAGSKVMARVLNKIYLGNCRAE